VSSKKSTKIEKIKQSESPETLEEKTKLVLEAKKESK
jgi:hypothetical protein